MVQISHDYARKVLGVGPTVSPDDLRKAWKKKARTYHPDQIGGCEKTFIEVNDAYEMLRMAPSASRYSINREPRAKKQPKPAPQWVDRRGASKVAQTPARTINVSGQLHNSCRIVLERSTQAYAFTSAKSQNGGFYVDPRAIDKDMTARGHVAQNVAVHDGRVTIKVAGTFAAGLNTVSMPSGTRASDAPSVVNFRTKKSGAGRIRLPEAAKSKAFPWAKEVQVVFTKGR